jgi:hypothetical protein
MSDYCKGCLTLRYRGRISRTEIDCTYVVYNGEGKCPCTLCVVKCMCDQGCPPFDVFRDSIDHSLLKGLFNE